MAVGISNVVRYPKSHVLLRNHFAQGSISYAPPLLPVRFFRTIPSRCSRIVCSAASATGSSWHANNDENSYEVSTNVKEKISAATEEVNAVLLHVQSADGKDRSHKTSGAEESQDSGSSNSKEIPGATETLFSRFKSMVSSASPKVSLAFQKLKDAKVIDLAKKGYDVVKDELSSDSKGRRRMQYAADSSSKEGRSTKTDIVVVPKKQSPWGKKWEAFKEKMQGHPVFKRISGFSEPVVTKGRELAEDMREHWETSDHPVVHKIQDLNESVFGETAAALSFEEIRRRDPSFSLPEFVAELQEMIRPTLNAYLKGDVEALKKNCSPEVIERCKAERQAYESQGIFFDNKILHISEMEVRETKLMGSTPIIIVAFQTQQVYCVRDRQGSITEGGKLRSRSWDSGSLLNG